MLSAGIKELKARLSSYIDKVRQGELVIVTEHGEEVAVLVPISEERKHVLSLVRKGVAHWSGNKPKGLGGIRIKGQPLSDRVLEERR